MFCNLIYCVSGVLVFSKNRTKFKSPGISAHLLCVKICRLYPHVLSQTVGLGWSRVEFIEMAA